MAPLIALSALCCTCVERAPPLTSTTSTSSTGSMDDSLGEGTSPPPTTSTSESMTSQESTAVSNDTSDTSDTSDGYECDPALQECGEGKKCVPYASVGTTWDSTKCVAGIGVREPGEPCMSPDGMSSGIDDCKAGSLCWDVDGRGVGTCVEMCSGAELVCLDELSFDCTIYLNGILQLCFPSCDPLEPLCSEGESCLPHDNTFSCTAGTGLNVGIFEPCGNSADCSTGLLCVLSSTAVECGGKRMCCLPLCDLESADVVCPGKGQMCKSIYGESGTPEEYAHVGVCSL